MMERSPQSVRKYVYNSQFENDMKTKYHRVYERRQIPQIVPDKKSHFRWQIRTFWFSVLWCMIASVLFTGAARSKADV
jgi:hypothetical protein